LARELKGSIANTDQANVRSLTLVKRAEEIEKLARRIMDLAKGA
jgi:hypothetical protein